MASKRGPQGQFGFLQSRSRSIPDVEKLGKESSDHQDGVNTSASEGQVIWHDPNRIQPWAFDDRTMVELEQDDSFEEIVDSISKWDVLEPLIVRSISESEEYDYEEVCGFKRLMACRKLGKKAPCIVRDDLNDKEAFSAQSSENRGRTAPSPWSRARSYAKAISDELFGSIEELANFCDLDRKTVSNMISAFNAMPDKVVECAPLHLYGSDTLIALNSAFKNDDSFAGYFIDYIESNPSVKVTYKKVKMLFDQFQKGEVKERPESINYSLGDEKAFSVTRRKSGYSVNIFQAGAKYLSDQEVADALQAALERKLADEGD